MKSTTIYSKTGCKANLKILLQPCKEDQTQGVIGLEKSQKRGNRLGYMPPIIIQKGWEEFR